MAQLAPKGILAGGYDLGRMKALMELLGNPQNKLKIIHVAGTSGKTSTAYFIAALLKEAGCTAGLTISPHIDEVNERIQVDLEPLPEAEFCHALTEFYGIVQASNLRPTYFEFLVAMAYWYFYKAGVDYAVIEVGLGGLLDGTNVIDRKDKVCVITDIGMDHMEVLGQTIAEIAKQKAGIITPGNEVFCNAQDKAVVDVLKRQAAEQDAKLHVIKSSDEPVEFRHLSSYQYRNWSLASAVFTHLAARDDFKKLRKNELVEASRVLIPGRMEVLRRGDKTIIFDGAHNLQKMQALSDAIRQRFPGQDIASLIALSKDYGHETAQTIAELSSFSRHIIITKFDRAQDLQKEPIDPRVVVKYLDDADYGEREIRENPWQGFEALLKRPEPVLVVTGSFFLLSTARKLLRKDGAG